VDEARRGLVRPYVAHCKRAPYDVYGGRPGPWGNPWAVGRDGSRQEVIDRFERYLLSSPALVAALPEIRGKVLGCWCAPQPCHCEVLAWHANFGTRELEEPTTMKTDKQAELDELYAAYARTAVLAPVSDGRRLVRGHGPLDSPLVVVGEAPGAEEERLGRPFVGPSGQLLQDLFSRAGLPWILCYVANVLPWRPPGNRTPYPFEVIASYRRVEAEIDVIAPVSVIAAGSVAWHAVSQKDLGAFSEARGKWHQVPWKDWAVLPVFHPSAILRAGHERGHMEADTVTALRSALGGASAA
jgi:uracil-DNA glycosylase family 4